MTQFLIGSYTNKEKTGLYQYDFNEQEGVVSLLNCYDGFINPSYIIVDPSHKSVYSVSETDGLQGGGVVKYAIDDKLKLEYVSLNLTQGDDPCHLTRFKDDLIVCNYASGNLSIHSVDEQGQLSEAKQTIQHNGHGINPDRQEGPHVHFACMTPNEAFVAVIDLGLDAIFFYEKQEDQYVEHSILHCNPGTGPRHLIFHPALPLIYVVKELSSTVSVYKYSADFRQFALIQSLSTIPSSFSEINQSAAIVMSQNHRHLYITNRGHNSIATYNIDETTGQLMLQGLTCAEGNWPRDCALSPCEAYLFVVNQRSDTMSIFTRDTLGGALKFHSSISVSEPTCIAFLETNEVCFN